MIKRDEMKIVIYPLSVLWPGDTVGQQNEDGLCAGDTFFL